LEATLTGEGMNIMTEEKKDTGPKLIDIAELREFGFLQEVNRCFFHPLGLALAININDYGIESLGCVWDSREDPEGFQFDYKNRDSKYIVQALAKMENVNALRDSKTERRKKLFGAVIEPISEKD
jgi:hypothetical protein